MIDEFYVHTEGVITILRNCRIVGNLPEIECHRYTKFKTMLPITKEVRIN